MYDGRKLNLVLQVVEVRKLAAFRKDSDGGIGVVVEEKESTCISGLAKLLPGNKLPCPDVNTKQVGEGDLSFNNQNRTPKRKFKDREEDFQSNCSPYAQESFYTIDRGRFTPKRKKANS